AYFADYEAAVTAEMKKPNRPSLPTLMKKFGPESPYLRAPEVLKAVIKRFLSKPSANNDDKNLTRALSQAFDDLASRFRAAHYSEKEITLLIAQIWMEPGLMKKSTADVVGYMN